MEMIVTSVNVVTTADFKIGVVNKKFTDSLNDYLLENFHVENPNDGWQLLICSDPRCESVHGIRYYSNSNSCSDVDFDLMKVQINTMLNNWVEEIKFRWEF
jgi:hypothetical protein